LAIIGPISEILVKSSSVVLIKLFIFLYFIAKTLAVFSPTFGIPNPKINLSREFSLLFSIASNRLFIDLSPKPSNLFNSFSCSFNE